MPIRLVPYLCHEDFYFTKFLGTGNLGKKENRIPKSSSSFVLMTKLVTFYANAALQNSNSYFPF